MLCNINIKFQPLVTLIRQITFQFILFKFTFVVEKNKMFSTSWNIYSPSTLRKFLVCTYILIGTKEYVFTNTHFSSLLSCFSTDMSIWLAMTVITSKPAQVPSWLQVCDGTGQKTIRLALSWQEVTQVLQWAQGWWRGCGVPQDRLKICNGLPLEPEIQYAPGLFMVELVEVAQGKGHFQGSP